MKTQSMAVKVFGGIILFVLGLSLIGGTGNRVPPYVSDGTETANGIFGILAIVASVILICLGIRDIVSDEKTEPAENDSENPENKETPVQVHEVLKEEKAGGRKIMFCPYCGTAQREDYMICKSCGAGRKMMRKA